MVIADTEFTCLRPLGQETRPGLTKAGRLSFCAMLEGRKVKIYETHSQRQTNLRQKIQNTVFGKSFLPGIIASEGTYVVEEWIHGTSALTSKAGIKKTVETMIQVLLQDPKLINLAQEQAMSFCYLQNYLYPRVAKWSILSPVKDFTKEWQKRFDELRPHLPIRISHPDLSPANIICQEASDRKVIIDNELLGSGFGWILDWHNSLLKEQKSVSLELIQQHVPEDFLEKTWRLRLLGSALDREDYTQALKIAKGK